MFVRATAAVSRFIPKSSQMLFPARSEESALLMWREGAPTRDPQCSDGRPARQMCLALAWRSALALPSSFPTLVTLSDLNLSSRAKSRDLLFRCSTARLTRNF